MMYTFKECPDAGFEGDIVLDMFNGTGATCIAARALGRKWIGVDLHPGYCEIARHRVKYESVDPRCIMLEQVRVKGAENSRQLNMLTDVSPTPIKVRETENSKQLAMFTEPIEED
jgi:site-specific DNA-methyltransferase (adenine-specific)